MKLPDFGLASNKKESENGKDLLSKEDQRAVELATRAQRGDYDDGKSAFISMVEREGWVADTAQSLY